MREEPTRARGPSGAIHLPFSALSVLSQRRLPQRQAAPVEVISRLACQPPGGFRGTPSPVEATKLRRLSRRSQHRPNTGPSIPASATLLVVDCAARVGVDSPF